jgi:hypothetical protein
MGFTKDAELRMAIHNFHGAQIELFKKHRTRIRMKMRLGVEKPISPLDHYLDAARYRRRFVDSHELPDLSDLNLEKQRLISRGKAEYENDIKRNSRKTPIAAIAMARRLRDEGYTQPQISVALADAGYLSATGKPFQQAVISGWMIKKWSRSPQEVIDMVFRLRGKGLSQTQICSALTDAGYLSNTNKPYTPEAIRVITRKGNKAD